MNATTSLKLFELTLEFMKDKKKAEAFVTRIEQTIEDKFNGKAHNLATKLDVLKLENDLSVKIYKVGLLQYIALVASILAIFKFMS